MQLCFGVSPGEVTWGCTSDQKHICNLFRAVNSIEQKIKEQCHVYTEENDDEDVLWLLIFFGH